MSFELKAFDAIIESVYTKDTSLYQILRVPKSLGFDLPKDTVIAGGYVVNILRDLDKHSIDIDIFLYGDSDYHERIAYIMDQFPEKLDYMRTNNYIQWHYVHGKGVRTIQIILNWYYSLYHLLNSFDLYASQVAFDGQNYWATKRGLLALQHNMNIFDVTKANTCYIHRLEKYDHQKGYTPIFDRYLYDI
jgi:hypothetical protein